ncbi:hypothetical protein ACOMHN_002000 [Nucella lapillus]
MVSKQLFSFSTLLILLLSLPGVRGEYEVNLVGIVVACSVAVFVLIVIILILAMVLTWNNWFPAIQLSKGKVKMPRSYWKKKEEAKMKLLNTSLARRMTSSTVLPPAEQKGVTNGNASTNSRVKDTASWVQGWNNMSTSNPADYEELILSMDLDEEKEEPEFRIETTLVDDETLDLGPFKRTTTTTTTTTDAPRSDPSPSQTEAVTPAPATASATTANGPRAMAEQAVSLDMGDEAEDEEVEHLTSMEDRPRQISASYTPPPPPPVAAAVATSSGGYGATGAVATSTGGGGGGGSGAVAHPLFSPPQRADDEEESDQQRPMSYSQFVDSTSVAF